MNFSRKECEAAAAVCRCLWWCAVCGFLGIYSIVIVVGLYTATRMFVARSTFKGYPFYILPVLLITAPCIATYILRIAESSSLGLMIRFTLTLLIALIALACFHFWLRILDSSHLRKLVLRLQRWCLWGLFPMAVILSWPLAVRIESNLLPRYEGFLFVGIPIDTSGWPLTVLMIFLIASVIGYFGGLFNLAGTCTEFREAWLKFATRPKVSERSVESESDAA